MRLKLLILFFSLLACQFNMAGQNTMNDIKKIEAVIPAASEEFMKIDGVEGLGQGKTDAGKDCIIVFVSGDTTKLKKTLPAEYKGFKVIMRDIGGKIDAQ